MSHIVMAPNEANQESRGHMAHRRHINPYRKSERKGGSERSQPMNINRPIFGEDFISGRKKYGRIYGCVVCTHRRPRTIIQKLHFASAHRDE